MRCTDRSNDGNPNMYSIRNSDHWFTFRLASVVVIGWLALAQGCGKPLGPTDDGNGDLLSKTVDYELISRTILQPKCSGCHSNEYAAAGVNYSTYASSMSSGTIVPRYPDKSSLYTTTLSGSMPQGGQRLSEVELNAISSWIANGALEGVPTPTATPTSSVGPQPTTPLFPAPTPTPSSRPSGVPSPGPGDDDDEGNTQLIRSLD